MAADLVMEEYTKGLSVSDESLWKRVVCEVMGDLVFRNTAVEMAIKHSGLT